MKTIVCYGDSNTYGYNPVNGLRYPKNIRWTGILQKLLGEEYCVIEEGCNGRTTIYDDPVDGWKNGLGYLKPCLNSHKPVDIVVLMLGSNDLKKSFGLEPEQIAYGVERLVDEIYDFAVTKNEKKPIILIMAPPLIGEQIENSCFGNAFDYHSYEKSKKLGKLYEEIAKRKGCVFLNAAGYALPSLEDCLHLSEKSHEKLARAVYYVIVNNEEIN